MEKVKTEDAQKYLESFKFLIQWKDAQQEILNKIDKEFNSLKKYMTQESLEAILESKKFVCKNLNKTTQFIGCIQNHINSLPDNELKVLLTYKYVNFDTWEQIAEKMECSLRWVYELHQRALSAFNTQVQFLQEDGLNG